MELQPVLIETERLILKGFSPKDMTIIFESYSKNEVMKLLGMRNDEEFKKEEYKQKNGYASYNRTFILFLLIEKVSNSVIGRCGLHNWNVDHKRAEIGYDIAEENYKRKGFMTEAVNAIIHYGFNDLKLHRIEALVGTENVASLRILEKQGFIKEGLLREHYYIDNKHVDSIMLSKLRSEYLGL
jgi:ribosomal-protein-alanine N-acetyltransferase